MDWRQQIDLEKTGSGGGAEARKDGKAAAWQHANDKGLSLFYWPARWFRQITRYTDGPETKTGRKLTLQQQLVAWISPLKTSPIRLASLPTQSVFHTALDGTGSSGLPVFFLSLSGAESRHSSCRQRLEKKAEFGTGSKPRPPPASALSNT